MLLFNLVTESLPIFVNKLEEHLGLRGFCIQGLSENTTVLQYADDTILFLHYSVDLEVRLHKCLLIFSLILGLKINLSKSSLYEVGLDEKLVQSIVLSVSCRIGSLPTRYLGLQL